ncbi:MAG: M28 family peptidase [Bacteroidales bacterium]|nr:M28 family peptidase [Bacteroidales bacterium]
MKKVTVYLSFVLAFFFANNLYSQKFSYNESEIKEILTFLADDEMKGRATGTKEDERSAQFIASKLLQYGFRPVIGDNPLVSFNLLLYREVGFGSNFSIGSKKFIEFRDFMVHPQSPSITLTAPILFPSENEQSFNGSAIVLKSAIDSIPFLAAKYKSKGCSAIIVNTGESLSDVRRGGVTELSIPTLLITDEIYSILTLETQKEVKLRTVVNVIEGTTYNVIMKFGRDDAPVNVLIGAHYDHLGMGGPSSGSMKPKVKAIHNGADDNASGVSSALEIGRLLSSYSDSLGIQVFVAAFGAEERGIIGSRVASDTLYKMGLLPDLMINLDMVGRLVDNKLQIGGVGTFAEANEIINNTNVDKGFSLSLTQDGYGPSDHSSFYTVGVPVLYFTTGVHREYHTPDDDIEYINFEGIGKISEYIASLISNLSSIGVPKYIKTEAPPAMSRASFKVTLGVIPDFTYEKGDGFRIGSVSDGKPADKGGMVAGDIIKKMNNKVISNIYEYMAMLGELKKGEVLNVVVDRDGVIINLDIQL